jgi:two-component system, response regulator
VEERGRLPQAGGGINGESITRGLTAIKLLLVEDNPDDVEIAIRAFRKCRLINDIHVVRDGEEALYLLFRDGDNGLGTFRPDLILLDLHLPKVSGFDVLDRIKTSDELSSIPVIVLTVSERDEDIARAYNLGANTYITKPVDFDKFMHAIDTIWEYWMVIAKLPVRVA